jgi:hypothetical protein
MTAERPSTKLTLSIVAGLVLVPLSAVLAVAIVGDGTTPQAMASETTTAVPTPEVQQIVFGAVAEATTDDIAAACGPAGEALVAAEVDGSITPLQQAALDALRPICDGLGTPLAAKQGPPPLVQTITRRVYESAAPAPEAAPTATDTSIVPPAPTGGEGVGTTTTTIGGPTSTTQPSTESWQSQYTTLHAQAEAEINTAIAQQGAPVLIAEAQRLLAEAESKASHGEWHDAAEKAYVALQKARQAQGLGGDD